MKYFLSFLFLYIIKTSTLTISVVALENYKTCFSETYPSSESIAFKWQIDENFFFDYQNKSFMKVPKKENNFVDKVKIIFFNNQGSEIGRFKSIYDHLFTYTTQEPETLSICVENPNKNAITVHMQMSTNISNNDFEHLPEKNHLKKYESQIIEIEELTEEMENYITSSRNKKEARVIRSREFPKYLIKISGLLLFGIIVIKVMQMCIIYARLQAKKLL